MSKVDVVLGLQWGDEGKGKVVDVLTPNYKVIARFQGGPNAGHSLVFDGDGFVLHTVPSGIFRPDSVNIIGNGVVIDPVILQDEIEAIEAKGMDITGKLLISKKAHLILPTHRMLDASLAASSIRCVGRIRCAFLEMRSLPVMSMPLASMASISSWRMTGSMTTPLPMMFTESGRKMPEGTVWRTNPSPSNTSE